MEIKDPLSPDTRAIIAVLRETNDNTQHLIADLQRAVDELKSGFPDDDPESHRRYHETIIEWRELRNRMVKEALLHAAKLGGLGAMGWVAYAVWVAFKMEITK